MTARIETEENRVVYSGPIRIDERGTGEVSPLGTGVKGENGDGAGCCFEICLEPDGEAYGRIEIGEASEVDMIREASEKSYEDTGDGKDKKDGENGLNWHKYSCDVDIPDGVHALYLIYHGGRKVQLKEIVFE